MVATPGELVYSFRVRISGADLESRATGGAQHVTPGNLLLGGFWLDNSGKERRFIGIKIVMRSSISMPAKLVYWDLDERAGFKGHCWPKQSTIAASMGISLRAVNEAIQELTGRAFLRVERQPKYLVYFLPWCDTHDVHFKQSFDTHVARADTHLVRNTRPASLYEQQNEPRKEQRCSLCGGSGIAGSTGADLGFCGCAAGDEERRRSA